MNDASRAGGLRPPGELSKTHRTIHQQIPIGKDPSMKDTRALTLAVLAGLTIATTGCSVMRGQTDVAHYIDDKTITAAIKAKMIEDRAVDAAVINVDTLNGAVALSGFAKSPTEKQQAENIARTTKGVREVRNNLIVRP